MVIVLKLTLEFLYLVSLMILLKRETDDFMVKET